MGLEPHFEEWIGIWWVERRMEKPVGGREKQGEKRKRMGWIWGAVSLLELGPEGKEAPGCHPRTVDDSCLTNFYRYVISTTALPFPGK